MQRQEDGVSRLKRVILIGDHHQLPPVVKNMAFQKYSHLDQSLFTRFVRLGTPYVQLNAQVLVSAGGSKACEVDGDKLHSMKPVAGSLRLYPFPMTRSIDWLFPTKSSKMSKVLFSALLDAVDRFTQWKRNGLTNVHPLSENFSHL